MRTIAASASSTLRVLRHVTADARQALKGIPRENYQIMTKVTTDEGVDPIVRFDEMRKASDTDYFDIMLLHWQHTGTWVKDTRNWQDAILNASISRPSRVTARQFTACLRCARCPARSGSRLR